jgi:hypothetical protein
MMSDENKRQRERERERERERAAHTHTHTQRKEEKCSVKCLLSCSTEKKPMLIMEFVKQETVE